MSNSTDDSMHEYKQQLMDTISETYPQYFQKQLLSEFEKVDLVAVKKRVILKENKSRIDLREVAPAQRLIEGLNSSKVVKSIERNEFLRAYPFSVVLNGIASSENVFKELEKVGEVQNFFSPNYQHDNIFDPQSSKEVIPTVYEVGNVSLVKFSKLITGHTTFGVKKQVKYNIVGVYFKHWKVLEIRMDKAKSYFQQDDTFYDEQMEFAKEWFVKKAKFNVSHINWPSVISYINKKEQSEVTVHSQGMSMSSGAKADLYTGHSGNSILPLLGELKELMKVNEELFEESPKIKVLLEKFIQETEETSDLPWISLLWKGKNNTDTIVKFKHDYLGRNYTLLNYTGRQSDMEKMNYVTEYIIENRNELSRIELAATKQIKQTAASTEAVS